MKTNKIALALGIAAMMATGAALAQSPTTFSVNGSNFTVYGNVDMYLNSMRSSSGSSLTAIQDGSILRTRLGLKGDKDVGEGRTIKFALEQGLNETSGAQADTTRLFDRQAWVGIATAAGEFRVGRQNTAVFYRGDYIDWSSRTMGSVINAFGVPSRYDGDLAYLSPRINGFMFEAHYALQGASVNSTTNQGVYQLALDYENGPYRVGYAGLAGKPAYGTGTSVSELVRYDNLYANYNYGKGKVYLAYVRSNNNGPTGALNNGDSPLGKVGTLITGTNAGAYTYYNIPQISADYNVTEKLRIGGLYGQIRDASGSGKNAKGWNVGAMYDVFKDTTVYLLLESLANDTNAGFRPSGSAGLSKTFTAAGDVNGKTISGVQLGFRYKF